MVSVLGCSEPSRAPAAPGDAATATGDVTAEDAATPEVATEDTATRDVASSDDASPEDTLGSDAASDAAPAERRVLFIGNSYTYVNDLPGLLVQLAATSGVPPKLIAESITVGGATLESHWTTGTAQARIDERGWYAVVLQGQSVEPVFPGSTFAAYALKFAARTTAAGALPVFFGTWARASGDAVYGEPWSGGTADAMQDRLTAAYSAAATKGAGVVAKVGEGFRLSLKTRPSLALHASDGSHPSLAGTYLAACVFYRQLAGKPLPATATTPAGLAEPDASFLRGIASALPP